MPTLISKLFQISQGPRYPAPRVFGLENNLPFYFAFALGNLVRSRANKCMLEFVNALQNSFGERQGGERIEYNGSNGGSN
jgi:hypothetical protein